jgi:hypothetical protein
VDDPLHKITAVCLSIRLSAHPFQSPLSSPNNREFVQQPFEPPGGCFALRKLVASG